MKSVTRKINNCRLLWCLLFVLLPFHVHSNGAITFDPEGEFISAASHAVLSSYAMEDYDVSFKDILKLNASELYKKEADLTNGIKGTVQPGGSIDLKAFAYGQDHEKHLIYHARLNNNSTNDFSVGTPQTVIIKIHKSDSEAEHPVNGTKIKELLQSVNDVYHVTKEDLDHLERVRLSHQRLYDDGYRHTRGAWGFLLGAIATVVVVVVGIAAVAATAGVATPFVVASIAVVGAVVIGGSIGSSIEADFDAQSHHSISSIQPTEPPTLPIPVIGSTEKVNYYELERDRKVIPTGAYPVQVVLEINNASFMGAKIPGIVELTPRLFQAWFNYTPEQLKQLFAKYLWSDDPQELNENDRELASLNDSSEYFFTESDLNGYANARLIINPAASVVRYGEIYSTTTNLTTTELTMGDHVILEVAVPIKNSSTFDEANPAHYPKLEGFPFTWMAFFSGEALYQCEPSIQPGEWRPWLGYDSQVHGTAMRKYPPNFDTRFSGWQADTSFDGYVIFRWTAKITRRMSAAKSSYDPVHSWLKTKQVGDHRQRNNQKEGLNMELLQFWKTNTRATEQHPDFTVYSGNRVLPGLDPDEFLYLRDSGGRVTDIVTLDGEPWKSVPADEAANPLNDIVTAYKKNRMWHEDSTDYRSVYGTGYKSNNYEIQDSGTSANAPNGSGTGNSAAPGRIVIHLPEIAVAHVNPNKIDIKISVDAPLETDKGFYGNIAGPEHPAVWEEGLIYQISGLRHDETDNYAVSFIHEDSLGHRKYLNFLSSQMQDHVRNGISENGEWYVAVPKMLGYGYYSVNLWYKNPDFTDSWTRIGGKELLDVSLRFLSVPGSKAGGAGRGYTGIDLKESPGDGAYIYLGDYLDEKHVGFATSKFHRFAKTHTRTYVFHTGDTSTFQVFDSDPHTFVHPGTEWYLSARTQAKRLTDTELNSKVRFYVDPIKTNGTVAEDHTIDGTGKKFTHQWDTPGNYQLKVAYNGISFIAHRIVVIDSAYRDSLKKADIHKRDLTSQQNSWLRDAGVDFGSKSWTLFSVENLDSQYRYIDGPRMHNTPHQENRFHPGRNYADSYKWKAIKETSETNYSITNSLFAPPGLSNAVSNFDDGSGWLPIAFVRHASETSSSGEHLPDDIANGTVSVSRFLKSE